jgi:hypothetical protein
MSGNAEHVWRSGVQLQCVAARKHHTFGQAELTRSACVFAKVDCSGERLTCVRKSSGFWNTFSYNIMIKTCKVPWGIPYSWATTWGASRNFISLYHYIIRKCVSKSGTFSYASQSFSRAIYFTRCYTPVPLHTSIFVTLYRLPYYQPNTLAGAINNFFIVYPQKYENCSTLQVLTCKVRQ